MMKNNSKRAINNLHKDMLDVEKGCNIAVEIITAINNNKPLEEYPYLKDCIENNSHFDKLSENIMNIDNYHVYNNIDNDISSFKKKINSAKNSRLSIINRKRIIYLSSSIAAALIVLSFYLHKVQHDIQLIKEFERTTPYVILSNGTEISVDSMAIAETNSSKINNKKIDNKLINSKEIIQEFNTIIVPSMCTYEVFLEDGSKVILNANSSLKYPVRFGKDTRSVELKGEAYFDISKGDIPFIVKNNHLNIKVFGTQFNISSSSDDTFSKAVLINGSIGVTINGNEKENAILVPNQMFSYDDKTNISKITTVNALNYIKWTSSSFKYQNTSINDIIEDIERWYGVQITGEVEVQNISMTINKLVDIDKLLLIIESATNVVFTKKGGNKYNVTNTL